MKNKLKNLEKRKKTITIIIIKYKKNKKDYKTTTEKAI